MKDYFQKDIPVLLNFTDYKELLNGFARHEAEQTRYDTRLIYNQRRPEELQLTIYYKSADHLYEKLDLLRSSGVNILDLIFPAGSEHAWVHPEFFIFSRSSLIELQETHYFEHDRKTLILILDNLDLFENGRYAMDGRFRLTENIFPHLGTYIRYGQLGNYDHGDRFIDRNDNRYTKFGVVNFILSFNHSYKSSTSVKDFVITRDAHLNIRDESGQLKDSELLILGEDLCLLMALYWEKDIDFFNAAIRVNDKEHYGNREVFKLCEDNFDASEEFYLKEQYPTFYDFAESLSFDNFQNHKGLLQESVPRLNKIKNLDDISAFMIFYNVIEKCRNYFLINAMQGSSFMVKEEFEFTLSKSKTNDFIKNKIKEIGEIVAKSDKEEFDSKASLKVTFIKKTGLIDQFESFISHLDLDPDKYDIKFEELIKIRNQIYHGNIPEVDVSSYNNEMKKLVLDILLKIIT
jgi:hypothetical protein